MRRLVTAIVPLRLRRVLRHELTQAPQRLRDLPADFACLFRPSAFGGPLPPPGLRARVGQLSRRVFRRVGEEGRDQLLAAFEGARAPGRSYPTWLDFGCGCGRLARFMAMSDPPVASLWGVDVDVDLVDWAARHLPGRYETMRPRPPLPFAAAMFDAVYATSIFSHYTETEQEAWLGELSRVLRPGGLLFATTISPALIGGFSGVSDADRQRLAGTGFVCVNPTGDFNARAAFHAVPYLEKAWGRVFNLRSHQTRGFVGYQDLSVWEKPGELARR
ncbi:MAG TPA: class I SAM-dependent methyltransferase [Thermoanaerobaculia bacterium]